MRPNLSERDRVPLSAFRNSEQIYPVRRPPVSVPQSLASLAKHGVSFDEQWMQLTVINFTPFQSGTGSNASLGTRKLTIP
jgi:hypothetical protein